MSGELPFEEIRPAEWAGKAVLRAVKAAAFAATLLLSGSSSVSAEKPQEKPIMSDTEIEACRTNARAAATRTCLDMNGCTQGMQDGLEELFSEDCRNPDDK